MLDFLPVDSPQMSIGAPLICQHSALKCQGSRPHLSVVAPLKCQYRRALIPGLSTSSVGNSRKIRRFRRFARLASSTSPAEIEPAPHLSTPSRVSRPSSVNVRPHLSVRAKFSARYPQRRRPRCLAHGFDGVSGAFAGP